MVISHRWYFRAILPLAVGMTASIALLPLLTAAATAQTEPLQVAQLFPQQSEQVSVPSGTTILVRYDQAEKIILTPDETTPVTLTVAQDIRSARGTVLIAAGSEVVGELRPDNSSTRFFSETITAPGNDRSLPIDATSEAITQTETISRDSDPDILKGAAIGAAAGAVLGEIFGSIDLLEVLGGAGAGALASILLPSREEVEVRVINPSTDLNLTLQSAFVLR
jgi:hypothetical protein